MRDFIPYFSLHLYIPYHFISPKCNKRMCRTYFQESFFKKNYLFLMKHYKNNFISYIFQLGLKNTAKFNKVLPHLSTHDD